MIRVLEQVDVDRIPYGRNGFRNQDYIMLTLLQEKTSTRSELIRKLREWRILHGNPNSIVGGTLFSTRPGLFNFETDGIVTLSNAGRAKALRAHKKALEALVDVEGEASFEDITTHYRELIELMKRPVPRELDQESLTQLSRWSNPGSNFVPLKGNELEKYRPFFPDEGILYYRRKWSNSTSGPVSIVVVDPKFVVFDESFLEETMLHPTKVSIVVLERMVKRQCERFLWKARIHYSEIIVERVALAKEYRRQRMIWGFGDPLEDARLK